MFRLPVSGMEVTVRRLAGDDDIFLREVRASRTEMALALVARLVCPVDGSLVEWGAISVADLETLLLLIRQTLVGDLIESDVCCSAPECKARVTVSFRISEYLVYHRSRSSSEVTLTGDSGWFQLQEDAVRFRLPAAADLTAVAGFKRPDRELMRRCIEHRDLPARLRRRVVAAMEAMAPCLSGTVRGECPECHQGMDVYFDVQNYVLRELRQQAASVYEDVHLLALNYKWSEESILMLPRERRATYAEMLR